jgi:hypothetical protein
MEKGGQTIAPAEEVPAESDVTPKCTVHMSYTHHDVVSYVRKMGVLKSLIARHEPGSCLLCGVGGYPHPTVCRLSGHAGEVSSAALVTSMPHAYIAELASPWSWEERDHVAPSDETEIVLKH